MALRIGREEGGSAHADAVLMMEHRTRAVEVLRVADKDYREAKEEARDENDPLLAIEKNIKSYRASSTTPHSDLRTPHTLKGLLRIHPYSSISPSR